MGIIPLDFDEVEEVENSIVEHIRLCGTLATLEEIWREPYCEGKTAWRWSRARLAEYRTAQIKAKETAEYNARQHILYEEEKRELRRRVEREKRFARVREARARKREERLEKKMGPLLHVLEDELVGKMSVRIGLRTFEATKVSFDPRAGLFTLNYLGPDGWEDTKVLPEHILRAAKVRLKDKKMVEKVAA